MDKANKAAKAPSKSAKAPIGHGVGRRKRAVARVWLKRGSGNIRVNGKDYKDYFDIALSRTEASQPFTVFTSSDKYDVEVNVNGGGVRSQAGAVSLGIARALVDHDASYRAIAREYRLLTRDPREKERKKPGQRGARRKFQFVKR